MKELDLIEQIGELTALDWLKVVIIIIELVAIVFCLRTLWDVMRNLK